MAHKKIQKFQLIASDLKARIVAGEFSLGHKLPPEETLSLAYKCSRPTLRKALALLQQEGYLNKVHGSGSFITDKSRNSLSKGTFSSDESMFFGLIFPNLGSGYVFDFICNQIGNLISQMGHSSVWGGFLSPESRDLKEQVAIICNNYIQLGVRGVFFSPFEYNEARDEVNDYVLSALTSAGIPVVLIDSDVEEFPSRRNYDLVSLDHIQASYTVATHMLNQGIERLIFLAPPNSMHTIKLRLIGYHEALWDKGIAPNSAWYKDISPSNINEVKSLITRLQPEGILCSNDGTAITLMHTLQSLGIRIPEDIIVAGFDDLSNLSAIRVPLTSFSQPLQEISETAVETMFKRMRNPNRKNITISLSGNLVVRDSTERTKRR